MSSGGCTIFGSAVLVVLLAGYLAQKYLPPPKPKIVGIDLGTTYSCIGVYHAVTGQVNILPDEENHKCIPSIVAFSENDVVVGYKAMAQAEHNAENTIYDSKRFIGKSFQKEELSSEATQYPFKLEADEFGQVHYVLRNHKTVTPEYIGSQILETLRQTAERNLSTTVTKAVISVPAEFSVEQRNYTREAARLAGIEILRIINEPTAAALAYGLHKKKGVDYVMVVDLGGGTLDVSLLSIQGGMFLTQAMAGNNHLGGQDFNMRLLKYVLKQIEKEYNRPVTVTEDMQNLRNAVEHAKLDLTSKEIVTIKVPLLSFGKETIFKHSISRKMFEDLNIDLFKKALEPIDIILKTTNLPLEYIDEIVLVGGSTRIPKIRQLMRDYFKKEPNTAIDPELAVVSGVAIQAGILGGVWPLTVSATELPTSVRKIHIN